MLITSKLKNFIKTANGVLSGQSIGHLKSFYNQQAPPTKFFKFNNSKIYIHCILCGFPRTGTHWIRNVIEKSTGKKTFNLYTSKPTQEDKEVILIKVHARNKIIARAKTVWLLPLFDFGGNYIYVFRDPRDSIISMYEMFKKEKGLPNLKQEKYLKICDPISQYRWEINYWVMRQHKDVLVIKFEKLKKHPQIIFQKIFNFLQLSSSLRLESIGEVVATSDSKIRPRGTAFGWKGVSQEYKVIIDAVYKNLDKEIKQLGYENIL